MDEKNEVNINKEKSIKKEEANLYKIIDEKMQKINANYVHNKSARLNDIKNESNEKGEKPVIENVNKKK